MPTEDVSPTKYFYDKSKLSRTLILFLLCGTISIWGAVALRNDGDFRHMLMWPGAALFVLASLATVRKLATREPALVIEAAGLILPQLSVDLIPWSAVQDLRRVGHGRKSRYLSIRLDPNFAKSMRRQGLTAFLARIFPGFRSRTAVPLNAIEGYSGAIVRRCFEALERDRETQRAALAADGISLPPFLVPVEAPKLKNGKLIFTYALIALLTLVYLCELGFGVDPPEGGSPSIQTLFFLGGTFTASVFGDGQWWRLFTAPLMHGSILHLAFNCISLWLAGALLERLIGWRWFAGVFFLSALGGSVASILINAPNIVGVGASGGIVGLFVAAIASSFHFQSTRISDALRMRAVQILIPSLLPFLSSVRNGEKVDYAAHLGGALVGGTVALAMLSLWPKQSAYPRFNKSVSGVTVIFLAVAAVSLIPIVDMRRSIVGDPMANYSAGLYQQAAEGFESEAEERDENEAYYYIWEFISETHIDTEKALAELRLNAVKVDPLKWPAPVIDVFLGKARMEELSGEATNNDQRCEALFYSGEWYRLQNDNGGAIAKFLGALSSCPKTFLEFDGATAEIAHLSANR